MPGAPDGDYVVMQFDTRLANKHAAVETVTFLQEKQDAWKAAGYYINRQQKSFRNSLSIVPRLVSFCVSFFLILCRTRQ
jgi:hypothetical protein